MPSGLSFWDKIVLVDGLRSWYERCDALRQDSQRISRHFYDLRALLGVGHWRYAIADPVLGADCAKHARTFFNKPDFDLAQAVSGKFALRTVGDISNGCIATTTTRER